MKKFLLMAALGLALAAAFWAPKVFAEDAKSGVSLPTDSPHKELVIKRKITNLGNPVRLSTDYHVLEGQSNPAPIGGLSFHIYAENILFTPNESGVAEAGITIPLGGLTFSKVGYYTVNIAERTTSDELMVPVDRTEYKITFKVYNELAADNTPTGKLLVALEEMAFNCDTEEKLPIDEISFESKAQPTYVRIRSTVTGALADADRYFKYKITFTDAPRLGGEVMLTVTGQDEQVTYGGRKIETENKFFLDSGGIIYLKHGQEVTVGLRKSRDSGETLYELPLGFSYEVESVDGEDDSYLTSIDNEEKLLVNKRTVEIGSENFDSDNVTAINHNREESVQTGAAISTLPFLAVALTGVGGFVLFRKLSKS